MRILALGDLHGKLPKIPKADIILLNGDMGKSDIARKLAFKKMENPLFSSTRNEEKAAYMEEYTSTLKVMKILGENCASLFYLW